VAARVTREEREAIQELARANDRTSSGEVRRAIRFYLANHSEAEHFLRERSEGGRVP
jgi:hypothetical protein